MARIALHTPDKTSFPNFALMKIAAYHRVMGDEVSWYLDIERNLYDRVYSSSVFSWTDKSQTYPEWITGGTGYDVASVLDSAIETGEPDYSIHPNNEHAVGFITRGCIRACDFCVVRQKEGYIRPYRDIDTILQDRKSAILLDNNITSVLSGMMIRPA